MLKTGDKHMKQYSKSLEISYIRYEIDKAYDTASDLDSIYNLDSTQRDHYIERAKALELQLIDLYNLKVDGIKVIA